MADRVRYRWSVAGITDDDETLITRLRRSGMLLVPRSVEIDYDTHSSIVYPVPDLVGSPVPSGADMRHFLFDEWDLLPLAGTDTSGILEEFLKLVDPVTVQVKHFVERWGPLWICNRHGREHHRCSAPTIIFDNDVISECSWTPRESVEDFQIAAREVRAVLSIAASLTQRQIGRAEDWAAVRATSLDVGPVRERDGMLDTLQMDRIELSGIIGDRLSFHGPSLSFDWNDADNKPALSVNTGFGFLRLVWQQVAQCIAGARDIYTCDGCGVVYIRDGSRRRPKEGCKNYCGKCAETARKRDWARRNRQK